MARELREILNSGEIDDIELADLSIGELMLIVHKSLQDGIDAPQIEATDAAPGTVFFNTDIGKLCFKRPDGFTVKFEMSVI